MGKVSNREEFGSRLLKADYHGCMLKVTRSSIPSHIGTEGILIQETATTFRIITPHNKLRIVPKKDTAFSFRFGSQLLTIYGNNFSSSTSNRSTKRFKVNSKLYV